MFGKGILKGLAQTGKQAVSRRLTEKYPEEKPHLPERWRGNTFVLEKDKCINCGLCAISCPNKVIRQKFDKDEDGKKICTEFVMERQYCLFCGLCVEACPKDCLHLTHEFETAVYSSADVPQDLLADNHSNIAISRYGEKMPLPKPVVSPKPVNSTAVAAPLAVKPAAGSEATPEERGKA